MNIAKNKMVVCSKYNLVVITLCSTKSVKNTLKIGVKMSPFKMHYLLLACVNVTFLHQSLFLLSLFVVRHKELILLKEEIEDGF